MAHPNSGIVALQLDELPRNYKALSHQPCRGLSEWVFYHSKTLHSFFSWSRLIICSVSFIIILLGLLHFEVYKDAVETRGNYWAVLTVYFGKLFDSAVDWDSARVAFCYYAKHPDDTDPFIAHLHQAYPPNDIELRKVCNFLMSMEENASWNVYTFAGGTFFCFALQTLLLIIFPTFDIPSTKILNQVTWYFIISLFGCLISGFGFYYWMFQFFELHATGIHTVPSRGFYCLTLGLAGLFYSPFTLFLELAFIYTRSRCTNGVVEVDALLLKARQDGMLFNTSSKKISYGNDPVHSHVLGPTIDELRNCYYTPHAHPYAQGRTVPVHYDFPRTGY